MNFNDIYPWKAQYPNVQRVEEELFRMTFRSLLNIEERKRGKQGLKPHYSSQNTI
jgi:hypothetical protein